MDLLSYQRTVFGFHGCESRVADAVLAGKAKLLASENTYDWLGSGIYFWEHGPAGPMSGQSSRLVAREQRSNAPPFLEPSSSLDTASICSMCASPKNSPEPLQNSNDG